MRDGTPYCRLCESPVPYGQRRAHVRQHQRERTAFKRSRKREQEKQAAATLRQLNREKALERRTLARAGGHTVAKPASTKQQDAPKRGSTKQLMAEIIRDAGTALHVKVITERVIASGKTSLGTTGKTPAATLGAQLTVAANKGDTFIKVAPATFGLIDGPQELPAAEATPEAEVEAEPTPAAEATPAEDLAQKATETAQAKGKDVTPDPRKKDGETPTKRPRRQRAKASA